MKSILSHSLHIGIVGLPNSGKSTIFNLLTSSAVPAENYPFCTIDKNIGVSQVRDKRLEALSYFFNAQKVVPSLLTFVDIAGLVKGASKGEGLGNQFLANIREVDVIMFVLRGFGGNRVVHVYDRVDPVDDLKILELELILKDVDTLERKLADAIRRSKSGADDKLRLELETLQKALSALGESKMLNRISWSNEESFVLEDLHLLSMKKSIFVLNVSTGHDYEVYLSNLEGYLKESGYSSESIIPFDIGVASEVSELDNEERDSILGPNANLNLYLKDMFILKLFRQLALIVFYTGSEKECNAWSVYSGSTVVECAGVIHSDLAEKFKFADICNVDELVSEGSWTVLKEHGKIKTVGKEYIVCDGDYIIVKI